MPQPASNVRSISDRARTSGGVDPQDGLFDKTLDNPDLEEALEEREAIRVQRLEVNKQYKEADDKVKGHLVDFELAVGEVARIGRFKIKKTRVAGREVEFSTEPTERLNIGVIAEEG